MNLNFPHMEKFPIPDALRIEHNEIRVGLAEASLEGGAIGPAARQVLRFCAAHFEEEERIVFPMFGLLRDLALGKIEPEMSEILPLIARFSARRDRLLIHHQSIAKAAGELLDAGHKERNREVANVAYMTRLHVRIEEEVTYPTVMLIGNYVRQKLDVSSKADDRLHRNVCASPHGTQS